MNVVPRAIPMPIPALATVDRPEDVLVDEDGDCAADCDDD